MSQHSQPTTTISFAELRFYQDFLNFVHNASIHNRREAPLYAVVSKILTDYLQSVTLSNRGEVLGSHPQVEFVENMADNISAKARSHRSPDFGILATFFNLLRPLYATLDSTPPRLAYFWEVKPFHTTGPWILGNSQRASALAHFRHHLSQLCEQAFFAFQYFKVTVVRAILSIGMWACLLEFVAGRTPGVMQDTAPLPTDGPPRTPTKKRKLSAYRQATLLALPQPQVLYYMEPILLDTPAGPVLNPVFLRCLDDAMLFERNIGATMQDSFWRVPPGAPEATPEYTEAGQQVVDAWFDAHMLHLDNLDDAVDSDRDSDDTASPDSAYDGPKRLHGQVKRPRTRAQTLSLIHSSLTSPDDLADTLSNLSVSPPAGDHEIVQHTLIGTLSPMSDMSDSASGMRGLGQFVLNVPPSPSDGRGPPK